MKTTHFSLVIQHRTKSNEIFVKLEELHKNFVTFDSAIVVYWTNTNLNEAIPIRQIYYT